jgi:hypothetical protein
VGSEDRFWNLETGDEIRSVRAALQRRFPETYSILSDSLEEADPMEVVYPGNPFEYDDVVREMLVLLAPSSGHLASLTYAGLIALTTEALSRCYDELADPERLHRAVELIRDRAAG